METVASPIRWPGLTGVSDRRFALAIIGDVRLELRTRLPATSLSAFDADHFEFAPIEPVLAGTAVNLARRAVRIGGNRFRMALWHYGTAVAAMALLRHPDGIATDVAGRALDVILRTQNARGYWPSPDTGTQMSLWGVWWCTEALSDVQRIPLAKNGDLVVWIPDGVVVARARPPGADRWAS